MLGRTSTAQRFIQGTEYTIQIIGDHPDEGLSGLGVIGTKFKRILIDQANDCLCTKNNIVVK